MKYEGMKYEGMKYEGMKYEWDENVVSQLQLCRLVIQAHFSVYSLNQKRCSFHMLVSMGRKLECQHITENYRELPFPQSAFSVLF